jgi:hypothetical protein
MIKVLFGEIDRAINLALEKSNEEIILEGRKEFSSENDYLSSYAYFVEKFGTPDFPCEMDSERMVTDLNLSGKLVSVWDFDYYLLSLVLNYSGLTVISKHNP